MKMTPLMHQKKKPTGEPRRHKKKRKSGPKRVEEVITKAEEVAYKKEQEQRAKVREAQKTLSTDDERLEKVISLLDDLESKKCFLTALKLRPAPRQVSCGLQLKMDPRLGLQSNPGRYASKRLERMDVKSLCARLTSRASMP